MRRPGAQLPEEFGKRGFGNTEGIQGDQLIAREDARRVRREGRQLRC